MKDLFVDLGFLEFPLVNTDDGGDESPALRLKGLDAVSVAIWVTNPFIRTCCSFSPWIVWDLPAWEVIPGAIPKEPVVSCPVPCRQGINDYGRTGYSGPHPPPGETHRYQFRVYGLDSVLDLPGGSSRSALVAAMRGHVIQYGETVAICTR
jgi:Raf kinase inhibitor-like YbhB/YbcL family protein